MEHFSCIFLANKHFLLLQIPRDAQFTAKLLYNVRQYPVADYVSFCFIDILFKFLGNKVSFLQLFMLIDPSRNDMLNIFILVYC